MTAKKAAVPAPAYVTTPNGNLEINLTIKSAAITQSYQKSLRRLAAETEIDGFRKGKAPLSLIEKKINKETVYREVIKDLIPQMYADTIKKHQLKPLVSPEIQLVSAEEGQDWQIKAITCQKPSVTLNNYRAAVAKARTPATKKEPRENQVAAAFAILLKTCQVTVPETLITQEVNRMLSRLIDQTNRLGISVEQYLASVKQTPEQIRHQYYHQAEDTLKLEFILAAIAEAEKTAVSDQEVQAALNSISSAKTDKNKETEEQRYHLKQLLLKQKTIDNLITL